MDILRDWLLPLSPLLLLYVVHRMAKHMMERETRTERWQRETSERIGDANE